MKPFLILRQEWSEAFNNLSLEDKGFLLDCMFRYNNGEVVDLDILGHINPLVPFAWKIIKNSFEHINDNYVINWSSKDKAPKQPKVSKTFVKPTVEEIRTYTIERAKILGLSDPIVDAEKFHAYYENRNWESAKVGSKMNWKNAVLTWESNAIEKKGKNILKAESPRTVVTTTLFTDKENNSKTRKTI